MSKATDETIIIPKSILQEALKQPCKYKQLWSDKEEKALRELCDKNWKPKVAYKVMCDLINKYARESDKPRRTTGQIRNKLDAMRLKYDLNEK